LIDLENIASLRGKEKVSNLKGKITNDAGRKSRRSREETEGTR